MIIRAEPCYFYGGASVEAGIENDTKGETSGAARRK
jgi:hypothetical protein